MQLIKKLKVKTDRFKKVIKVKINISIDITITEQKNHFRMQHTFFVDTCEPHVENKQTQPILRV